MVGWTSTNVRSEPMEASCTGEEEEASKKHSPDCENLSFVLRHRIQLWELSLNALLSCRFALIFYLPCLIMSFLIPNCGRKQRTVGETAWEHVNLQWRTSTACDAIACLTTLAWFKSGIQSLRARQKYAQVFLDNKLQSCFEKYKLFTF